MTIQGVGRIDSRGILSVLRASPSSLRAALRRRGCWGASVDVFARLDLDDGGQGAPGVPRSRLAPAVREGAKKSRNIRAVEWFFGRGTRGPKSREGCRAIKKARPRKRPTFSFARAVSATYQGGGGAVSGQSSRGRPAARKTEKASESETAEPKQ